MYRIVLLSLFSFPFSARCQYSDTTKIQHALESRIHRAGIEFLAYQKQVDIGTALEIVGGVAAIGGAASDAQVNKGLIDFGIGLSLVGYIIERFAISHIGKAGFIMRGNSVVIPLGK
jgi:hypothetical protein